MGLRCIAKLDVDGDGSVDLQEFVERMGAIRRRQLQGRKGEGGEHHHLHDDPALSAALLRWLRCPDGWREQADADDPIEVVDGVKLCNNALTSVCGLGPALKPFLLCNLTTTLQWLDLSFNTIAGLDGEALGELPNLAILNLHVNKLSKFGSVAGLAKLARLEKLTLHGNPLACLLNVIGFSGLVPATAKLAKDIARRA